MARMNKLGKTATTVRGNMVNGELSVVYHSTEVVNVKNGIVTLNTGGYFTNTTKTRMNQAANQFGLPFMVYAKRSAWICIANGRDIPFDSDSISFSLK